MEPAKQRPLSTSGVPRPAIRSMSMLSLEMHRAERASRLCETLGQGVTRPDPVNILRSDFVETGDVDQHSA